MRSQNLSERVTVLIATRDRRPILERTLAALERQSWTDLEVVVVDDGSTDDTSSWLESRKKDGSRPWLRVLHQGHAGQGRARNLGLEEIDAGLVVFLGDDILLRPRGIAEHVAAHRRRRAAGEDERSVGVVGFTDWCRGAMRVTPLLEMIAREGHQFGYGHMRPGEEVPFTCFYTSNLSIHRRALGEDRFDPAFSEYGWEDIELGYRLVGKGLRLYYEPGAAAEHLHPMGLPTVWERQRLVGRGLGKMLRLHPELADSPYLAPAAPPWWFGLSRRIVPGLVPLIDRLDRAGVRLPKLLLHNVLMCAYYSGRRESLALSGPLAGGAR